jgi:hypothetical protein
MTARLDQNSSADDQFICLIGDYLKSTRPQPAIAEAPTVVILVLSMVL